MSGMDTEVYLRRIGIEPASIEGPDLGTLERLLSAHIRQVPFENFSIVGDPYGPYQGEDIELTTEYLYNKIIKENRGGYCFELNGLFYSLLTELGFEADRIAARIVDGEDARPPANHHSIVVQLDRRYIVDVGLGIPKVRRPVPLDGEQIEMTDCDWRVVESDRPDEQYVIESPPPTAGSGSPGFYSVISPVTSVTSVPRTITCNVHRSRHSPEIPSSISRPSLDICVARPRPSRSKRVRRRPRSTSMTWGGMRYSSGRSGSDSRICLRCLIRPCDSRLRRQMLGQVPVARGPGGFEPR